MLELVRFQGSFSFLAGYPAGGPNKNAMSENNASVTQLMCMKYSTLMLTHLFVERGILSFGLGHLVIQRFRISGFNGFSSR